MDPVFIRALERVRKDFGQPMTVNSGYRCEAHNKKEGGVPGSAHTLGLAADVACPDGRTRHGLVFHGIKVFNRIGIGTNFVHFDIDASKPHEVIWVYPRDKWNPRKRLLDAIKFKWRFCYGNRRYFFRTCWRMVCR